MEFWRPTGCPLGDLRFGLGLRRGVRNRTVWCLQRLLFRNLLWQLAFESRDSVSAFGWGFLTGTRGDPVNRVFGAAPAIYRRSPSHHRADSSAIPRVSA